MGDEIDTVNDEDQNKLNDPLQYQNQHCRDRLSSYTSSIVNNLVDRPCWLCNQYSKFVVKYPWCFVLLGFIICGAFTLVILHRDLPDFNDPTKGFVPRGENTLTSRLYVLEKIKNELEKQLALARLTDKTKLPSSSDRILTDNTDDEDEETDFDSEDSFNVEDLIEDLKNGYDECAFATTNEKNCITNGEVYHLLRNQSDFLKISKNVNSKLHKSNEHMCTSIDLNRHYEFYFESADESLPNLLTIDNLLSLCEKQYQLVELLDLQSTCHYSLPEMVAYFSDKTDCRQLTTDDIDVFIKRIQRCHSLYDTGLIRSAGLKRYRVKPLELYQYDFCFRNNFTFLTLEYLVDKDFLNTSKVRYSGMWFLKPSKSIQMANGTEFHTVNSAYDLFKEHFYRNRKFDDGHTRISALNFLNIRIPAAMKQIRVDMFFVVLAIILIIGVTVIYLRSITIALMTNICVVLSFICAYFAYKVILGIDLFPYINLMATFILIGISCDNVFVMFDAWYAEKLDLYNEARLKSWEIPFYGPLTDEQKKQYQEDKDYTNDIIRKRLVGQAERNESCFNNDIDDEEHFDLIKNTELVRKMKVTDEQMAQMMGGVLRHAAASVFVTSFTTSAAFFTNLISRIAYVQLFGLFLGLCILFNFLMTVTMIVSFIIIYERYIEKFSANCCLFNRIPKIFDKFMIKLTGLNHKIFTRYIPRTIISCRFVLIIMFFVLGVLGLLVVFYHPKLTPPKSRRYQFFQMTHPFERFEYQMRDEFLSYINEDKENVTNPMLLFIFGVEDTDLIHPFYPDQEKYVDGERIVYNKNIDFYDPNILRWFDTFLKDLNQSDLFVNVQQTYAQWLTIGQLLRGFLKVNKNDYSTYNDNEFFVPPTKNDTLIGMSRLLKFFSESNQFASSAGTSQANTNIRLGFLTNVKTKRLRAFLFIVNMNVTFDSYSVQHEYYQKLHDYFETRLEQLKLSEDGTQNVYEQVKHGWFVSPQFLFYDLMREVIRGTYTSLIFSMLFALIVLLLTSGNIIITFYAMLTIIFIIVDTVAIFVLCGWELNILETIIIIMSVGLSVDFTVHYGVAYIKADWKKNQPHIRRTSNALELIPIANGDMSKPSLLQQKTLSKDQEKKNSCLPKLRKWHRRGNKQRFRRLQSSLVRVGSAVFIAGFTSFLAGLSMAPSQLTSFSQMGVFLMLIMFISWLYATWFFLPLLSFIGPIDRFGDIRLSSLCKCQRTSTVVQHSTTADCEQENKK